MGLFEYKVKNIIKVIDGDTIRADVDMGLRTTRTITLRLADINAPEVYGPNRSEAGVIAREALENLLIVELYDREMKVFTYKDRKSFDRYVGHIYFIDNDGIPMSVSAWMVNQGYAAPSTWEVREEHKEKFKALYKKQADLQVETFQLARELFEDGKIDADTYINASTLTHRFADVFMSIEKIDRQPKIKNWNDVEG